MNVIGYKHIYLTVSGLLVLGSIVSITVWGLKFGIDFTGGSLLEVEFLEWRPSSEEIKKSLEPLGIVPSVQPSGERGVILRFAEVSEITHQEILRRLKGYSSSKALNNTFSGEAAKGQNETLGSVSPHSTYMVVEKRFDSIGPVIGGELKRRAIIALGLALVAIVLYIAWAFRQVSKPVSSWKYGIVAIIALIHDVIIPTGIFAVLGKFSGVEIDILFITALLTILGFSVHDTIVVFDRIRENLSKLKREEPYEKTVSRSINETLARSINTSLTTLIVLVAIFFFGGSTTKYLALALSLGIIFGTYSSIFVASPLLVVWNNFTKKS